MTTITTRNGKGSPLTSTELDANFTNLQAELDGKYSEAETDAKIVELSPPATKSHVESLGILASSITGALPAISGENLTNLPFPGADQASMVTHKYVATDGQTDFTGNDTNNVPLGYIVSGLIVFLNGVRLDTSDFTATNGTSIVLGTGATTGSELVILAFKSFTVADHYTKAQADVLLGDKVDDSQVLTNVPSGAVFTDTNTETTTSISHNGSTRVLSYVDEVGTTTNIDLAQYIDDTNLARLVNGSLAASGIATFTRDDSTTFTIDMSDLLDTETNTWRGIDNTPVNGQTGESISSNWAFDHAASSTAHPRDTRNQIAGTYNNYFLPHSVIHEFELSSSFASTSTTRAANSAAVKAAYDRSWPDTNTTYSVGDGGLSEINFTSADHTKLNGIATSANNYVLPSSVIHQTELSSNLATKLPLAGGTMTGDTYHGDNVRVRFGTSSDLQMYHDGSNSYIVDSGTGNMIIRGTEMNLGNADGSKTYLNAISGGALYLRHNGGTKLATTATGVDVTGVVTADGLTLGDNEKAKFGASGDLEIYSDGANSRITESGSGSLIIKGTQMLFQTAAGENSAYFTSDGSVRLYHNNVSKFETTSTGIDVTGGVTATTAAADTSFPLTAYHPTSTAARTIARFQSNVGGTAEDKVTIKADGSITTTGNVDLADNGKLLLGNADDLQIYHDGNNSYVRDMGTGNLLITTDGGEIRMTTNNANEFGLRVVQDGYVALYHDNAAKLSTTSTGIDVTGTVTADGLTVDTSGDSNSSKGLVINTSGTNFESDAGIIQVTHAASGATTGGYFMKMKAGGADKFTVKGDGTVTASGLAVGGNVAVGLNQDIAMDNAGAGQLTIDGVAYKAGVALNADGMQIYTTSATRDVILGVNETEILRVKPAGIDVTGTVTATSFAGDGSALTGITDATKLPLAGGTMTGNLNINNPSAGYANIEIGGPDGSYIDLKSPFSDDYDMRFITSGSGGTINANGTLLIQHTGATKLATSTTGVTVTGNVAATGNITAYYSDQRLKTSTGNIENAIDKVMSLDGFTYVENDLARSLGYSSERQQVGISAQQIQAVLPEAVSMAPIDMETHETTGEITSKSGENYLTVDYSRIVPLLIEAIKEQQVQIDELKALVGGA